MPNKSQFSKAGFLKSYLLPALIIFLIPGVGLWFFEHVENSYDRKIRADVLSLIASDQTHTEQERARATEFYQKYAASRILASNNPKLKSMQDSLAPAKTSYTIFRWMKRIALTCLIAAAGAFVAVGIGVLFSFRSQRAQYWSLRLGWVILRLLALVEVVGQGVLAVALSFWMTAFWFERYYVKLIVVAALLAGGAVLLLIKAIFQKTNTEGEFVGRLLHRNAAPALWESVCNMASRLGIAPPDNIFAGIDDNFFVTEHPVRVGGERYTGRTLFVSLSLLKTLSRSEADAVLGHELAHFSGEDTIYSKKVSPLLAKYACYLDALYQGAFARPVFYFMFFFWNLYQLSLGRIARQREFRADRIGANMTSPKDVARSLVKILSYSQYRQKVQASLFENDREVEKMDVSTRIEQGFPAFISASENATGLKEADIPHPFDSHPPLCSRIESLGLDPDALLKSPGSLPDVRDSWFSQIQDAAAIEAEQWKQFEDAFQNAHQVSLAYRFKPEGEAEMQHVVRFFPEVEFQGPKSKTAKIDYHQVSASEWDQPVPFSTITECKVDETFGRIKLVIQHMPEGTDHKQKSSIAHKDFKRDGTDFLDTFQKYYGRHLAAKEYLAERSKAAEPKESVQAT